METYLLKVYRGSPGKQYWESFECKLHPAESVLTSLKQIQQNSVNVEGKRVAPIVWEAGCLEEVCGSCSMLVNGNPRQACTALIGAHLNKDRTIKLAPFTKFPLIRDLVVDRSAMFEHLKQVEGWIEGEKEGGGPPVSPKTQELIYSLSTCMTCGCCLEGCPQVNRRSKFVGPAVISQARLFNAHPTGKKNRAKRLHVLMEEGGIADCGNAQNCVKVCPKNIPLTESIAAIGADVTFQAFRDLLS